MNGNLLVVEFEYEPKKSTNTQDDRFPCCPPSGIEAQTGRFPRRLDDSMSLVPLVIHGSTQNICWTVLQLSLIKSNK